MTHRSILAGVLALAIAGLVPHAAHADAAAGARLAQRWCASCHIVDGGAKQARVLQGPPSFRVIARRLDAEQLRVFLTRPHPPMPDLALTRTEIDNLIAYIETLR